MSTSLDLDDIQGNILAGFNTNIEAFVGLTSEPERLAEAAQWVAALAPQMTSVAEVKRQRAQMKAPLRGVATDAVWLGLALGSEFFRSIRPDVVFLDEGFFRGFAKRAVHVLGDKTAASSWRVNSPSKRLDVLLTVASNDEAVATARADSLAASASASGLAVTYRETARRIKDLEHFGFRDGISQPQVEGYDLGGAIAPGHFVFGYTRLPGEARYVPATDPGGYVPNGSFMVFRRLAQDVGAFRGFCVSKAAELQSLLPGLTDAHLAALLVGRWPSGALATMQVSRDPQFNDDDFDFSDDPSGQRCPFGAHIRKVNPRAGPRDVVELPRILRRGIPFGPPFEQDATAERGLAFVSFQTSIVERFELLTAGWMNSPLRPAPAAGHDLLVGQAREQRTMALNRSGLAVEVGDGGATWVTSTGGGYLFAPSKSATARLAAATAPGLGWRTQRIWSTTKNALKEFIFE